MFNNSKGQVLFGIFSLAIIGIIWIVGLSGWINEIGLVSAASTSGLEAFAWSNINLLIGFFYIIAWFIVVKYG